MATPVVIHNIRDNYVDQAKPKKHFPNLNRILLSAQSGSQKQGYIYFGRPWPAGANIQKATLRVWNAGSSWGNTTITAQRVNGPWAANRLNWSNRPGVIGATASITKVSPPNETFWDIDITALLQAVSNGSPWYGIRLIVNGGGVRKLFTSNADRPARRPRVTVHWSDAPDAPEGLSPGGGRVVTIAQPTLSYIFTDNSGDTTLDAHQIQLSTTEAGFGSPILDTGWLTTNQPEFNLSTSAYPGLDFGSTLWWRVRVRDGSGMQSVWSDPTSFSRETKGVLNIDSMGLKNLHTNLVLNPTGKVSSAHSYSVGIVAGAGAGTGETGFGEGGFGQGGFGGVTTSSGEVISTSAYGLLAVNGQSIPGSQFLGSKANVTAGKKYSVIMHGGMLDAQAMAQTRLRWLNASGTPVGQDIFGPEATPWSNPEGAIEQTIEGITAPVGATQLVVGIYTDNLLPGAGLWTNMRFVQEGEQITAPHPFDGDTVDGYTFDYEWSGAPHSSTSIMSGYYVEDTSPPVFWTFSGQVQQAYRVMIWDMETWGAAIYDSGKITSTSDSVDTPDNTLRKANGKYRLIVQVWDNKLRENIPGDPIAVSDTRDFVYSPTSSVAPPLGLTAKQQNPWPWVQLNFNRSTPPDSFTIFRNNQVLHNNVDPADLFVGGSSYQYIDRKVAPRKQFTYRVVANVNRRDSLSSSSVVVITNPGMTWMMNPDTSSPIVFVKSAAQPGSVVEITQRSMQTVHQTVGGQNPVLISQYVAGYDGKVEAVLASGIVPGLSAQTMLARFDAWRANPGVSVYLYTVDRVLEVVPYNMTSRARAKSGGEILYDVAFDFFEVV